MGVYLVNPTRGKIPMAKSKTRMSQKTSGRVSMWQEAQWTSSRLALVWA